MQEEIADIIENSPSGPTLSKTDRTQLRTALFDHLNLGTYSALNTNNLLHIEHQEASGVNGGGCTAATWNVRTMNTALTNNIAGASLGSNQITLPAGTYWIEIMSGANAPSVSTQMHKARLRNITDLTSEVVGSSETTASNTTDDAHTKSIGANLVTIAASKVFELQHYTSQTLAGTGLGTATASGEVEMYAFAKIWKVA